MSCCAFPLKSPVFLRQSCTVQRFLPIVATLFALAFSTEAQEANAQKRYTIYAQLLEDMPVELSDGGQWVMDKGDCFPIYMFKEQQTKVVLQLASTTFRTDASRVRIVKPGDEAMALASYRKNLDSYLKSQAKKWRDKAKKE